MKIYPVGAFRSGKLYFRNALTVESEETTMIEAEMNTAAHSIEFKFQDISYQYNYKHHELTTTPDGLDVITLTYFFKQEMVINNVDVIFISFVFDRAINDEYDLFKVHSYFNNYHQQDIILKDQL